MQISLSKFLGVLVGVAGIGMFLYFLYLSYDLIFNGEKPADTPSVASVNVGILGPKMQKSASALVNTTDKIALKEKDIAFTKSALFKSFTEKPEGIPLSESRGRADPFVPYVAP